MQITVNGEPRAVRAGATVADLLTAFELPPQRVAVEINANLVRRAHFPQTVLRAGDRVEIVTLVGGG